MPVDWIQVVMILIQLRPICLSSEVSKVFARMLLRRTSWALKYSGPVQTMGESRQPADYMWTIRRILQLDAEWQNGLYMAKVDVRKAFDHLNRDAFLERLLSKIGPGGLFNTWKSLFFDTSAVLQTPWGCSTVSMEQGRKSPQVFSTDIDVARRHRWQPGTFGFEGLRVGEVAFVDDIILWHGRRVGIAKKLQQLAHELHAGG